MGLKMKEIKINDLLSKSFNLLVKRPSPKNVLWLNYAVTYLCNSRCVMCSIWKKYREQPELLKSELTIEEIRKFASSQYLSNLQGVSLTGGEPMLRRDIVDIAGIFIKRHPDAIFAIATNGLNPKLILDRTKEIIDLYEPTRFSISLSLDGLFEKHDEIRGIAGAYESLNKTIDFLKSKTDVNIGIDFTITPWNYKELLNVYRFTGEEDIIFLAGFAHNSEAYYGNKETRFEWDAGAMDEIEESMKAIVADRIKNEPLLRKLADPYAYFLSRCVDFQRYGNMRQRCYSGVQSLFLDPQGNVYPCIILGRRMGNIKQGFEKVWTSLTAEEIREYIKSGNCRCWVACESVPSMLRNLDFVKWNLLNKFNKRW